MPRESKKARDARVSTLLAQYDAENRALNKLTATVKALKEQVRELDYGTYGDWQYAGGTPREQLDQRAAKEALTAAGIPIPTKATEAPIVVTCITT